MAKTALSSRDVAWSGHPCGCCRFGTMEPKVGRFGPFVACSKCRTTAAKQPTAAPVGAPAGAPAPAAAPIAPLVTPDGVQVLPGLLRRVTLRPNTARPLGVVVLDDAAAFAALTADPSGSYRGPFNRYRSGENAHERIARLDVDPGRREFLGVSSRAALLERITLGWAEGAALASKLAADVRDIPSPVSVRRRFRWGADGDALDADRALAGAWDTAWQDRPAVATRAPRVLTVLVPVGGSGGLSPDDLAWAPAAALALVDRLEAAGYGVEVLVASVANGGEGSDVAVYVPAKSADAPLRLDILAGLAAPSSFRSGIFAGRQAATVPVNTGMGASITDVAQLRRIHAATAAAGLIPAADVVLPPVYSEREARAAVADALRQLDTPTTEV